MKKKGFTLIELIVSIILVSVILVSLMTTLVKIRQAYGIVNENSDVLIYTSTISRVINNDLSKNMGINSINCETANNVCRIILGNTETRELRIDDIITTDSTGSIVHENEKTTLKYINTTKGNNDLIYIKTLSLDRFTNTETNRVRAEGYNFLNINLNNREYENTDGTIDVISTVVIDIYDGVDASNSSDYDITIYSSNRYDTSDVKGRTFLIVFDNDDADYAGTMSMEEDYAIGFFDTTPERNRITNITTPTKIGYYFNGYFYNDRMVIDEYGTIVASNRTFNRNISNLEEPTVKALWTQIPDPNITFNPNGGNAVTPSSKTVEYGSTYGDIPNATRNGYTFLGWFTKAAGGSQIISSTPVKIRENQTLYAHWEIKSFDCPAGKYLKANTEGCSTCATSGYCPSAGTYEFNPTITQGIIYCPGSMTAPLGSTEKTACNITCAAGKYVKANQGTCATCTAGSFCPGKTCNFNETSACGIDKCARGSYSTGSANTKCIACEAGTTTSGTGATSSSSCTACTSVAGLNTWATQTWESDNTISGLCTPSKCNAGYKLESNQCKGCEAGTFSASAGSTSCTACAQGSISTGSANTGCTACQPSGETGTGGTTSGTGKSTCDTSCGKEGVSTWDTASWSNNTVSNSCKALTCTTGYELSGTSCN